MAIQLVENKNESYWIVRYYEPNHKKTLTLRAVPSTSDWDNHGPTGPSRRNPKGPGLLPKKPWNHWPGIKFTTQSEAVVIDLLIHYIVQGGHKDYGVLSTLLRPESCSKGFRSEVVTALRSSVIRGDLRRKRYSRIR